MTPIHHAGLVVMAVMFVLCVVALVMIAREYGGTLADQWKHSRKLNRMRREQLERLAQLRPSWRR
jgi:hypothetical protein